MVPPHSGLYFKLRKYNLPYPEAVFDGGYFRQVEFWLLKIWIRSDFLFILKSRDKVEIMVFSMLFPPRIPDPSMGWSGNFCYFPKERDGVCEQSSSREIFPETLSPTTTHKFFSLLHQKGLLRRIYTQNIDALEVLAGIPPEKIIGELLNYTCVSNIFRLPCNLDPIKNLNLEAHGSFQSAYCTQCRETYDLR